MSRSELSQPFFAPFADGSGASAPKEIVSQQVISMLENVFNAAGATSSEPDNPHERLLRSTGDMEGEFVGNEIFLWENGRPVLHMHKELYLEPQEDGTTYQADWLMDPGNNSPLHHIYLRTLSDRNLITIGMQHPSDPTTEVSLEYLHGPQDSGALAGEASRTGTGLLIPTAQVDEQSQIYYLDERRHQSGSISRSVIKTVQHGKVLEAITYPDMLGNVPTLIAQLEASWIDLTADPNQPWKHLLEDYGIRYFQSDPPQE